MSTWPFLSMDRKPVAIKYCVVNSGNVGVSDGRATGKMLGGHWEVWSPSTGESICSAISGSVPEGQFSSTGKAVAYDESTFQACTDEYTAFCRGVIAPEGPAYEIPEFPTVILPVMLLTGLAWISGRRAQ